MSSHHAPRHAHARGPMTRGGLAGRTELTEARIASLVAAPLSLILALGIGCFTGVGIQGVLLAWLSLTMLFIGFYRVVRAIVRQYGAR